MRCLHALGEWPALSATAWQVWNGGHTAAAGTDALAEVASLGATAALSLAVHARGPDAAAPHWEAMESYVAGMVVGGPDALKYRAVLQMQHGRSLYQKKQRSENNAHDDQISPAVRK